MILLNAQECLACEWNGNRVFLIFQFFQHDLNGAEGVFFFFSLNVKLVFDQTRVEETQIRAFGGSNVTDVLSAAGNGSEIRPKQHPAAPPHQGEEEEQPEAAGATRCAPVQCVYVCSASFTS